MTMPADPIPADARALTPTEIREALRAVVAADAYVVELLSDMGECHGYGLLRTEDPRDFTPDVEECTPEELANHRAAVEAVERGEPVPEHPFTPDAVTVVDGVVVHACGGPWGIGSYVVRDPDVLAVRDSVLAARPALAALDGMCILPVEVVQELIDATEAHLHLIDRPDAVRVALAAAAAEVRRVEEQR